VLPGSTRIADIQWVPSTLAPIVQPLEYARTHIKGFLLHNTTNATVNVKIHVVPANDALLGTPSGLTQVLDVDIQAKDVFSLDLSCPITLRSINDSIQAVASSANAVTVQVLGVFAPRGLASASLLAVATEFATMPPSVVGDRVALVEEAASIVSALPPGSWNPSQMATQIWLDAADPATITTVSGAVSQWLDKSGNARHVTQDTASHRPLLSAGIVNGLDALDFDGSDDRLLTSLNITSTTNWLIAAVFRPKDTGTRRVVASSNNNYLMSGARPSNTVYALNGDLRSTAWLGVNELGIGIALAPASGNLQFWGNGSNLTSGSLGSRAWGIVGLGAVQFGETASAIFCELIVAYVTDSATRQLIEGYLAHKWGTTGSLPAGHPYKTSLPQG